MKKLVTLLLTVTLALTITYINVPEKPVDDITGEVRVQYDPGDPGGL